MLSIARARLDEIFEKIKKQIILTGFNPTSQPNLFIVGGGSNLTNLENYCSNFFDSKVKKLEKNNKKKIDKEIGNNFDSCLGAVKLIKDGWETEAIPESADQHSQKTSFFAKIFRNRT